MTNEKRSKKALLLAVLGIICAVGIILISACDKKDPVLTNDGSENSQDSSDENTRDQGTETGSEDGLDASLTYSADIVIRDYGTITVKLDQKSAPITVLNFVNLAKSGFYDGLTFHRIKKGFMMQGGDPNGNGYGGSGNTIVGEFTSNGYNNTLSHTRGAISMARSKNKNSASSQFFIVHQDSTYLDGDYAVFGYVTSGMDVVDAVCNDAKPIDSNGMIPADAQPVITSVTIRTE